MVHGGGTSDRTYKVLASKGFLLTQPWENMEKDFKVDKDLVIFENEEEFIEKSKYYLNHDNEREIIASSGYNTVQKFNRTNWAKRILDIVIESRKNKHEST
jgi:spore maturation protein CgeB